MCGAEREAGVLAGDSHSLNASPSIAHSNVAPFSLVTAKNAKATVASPPASGSMPPVISGGPYVIFVSRPLDGDDAPLPRRDRGVDGGLLALEHAHLERRAAPSGRPL